MARDTWERGIFDAHLTLSQTLRLTPLLLPPKSQRCAHRLNCLRLLVVYSQLAARKVFILERSDSETVCRLLCHNMCFTSSFAVLPLCYVLNLPLVFHIFYAVCDGFTRETLGHETGVQVHCFRPQSFCRGNETKETKPFFGGWKIHSAANQWVSVPALSGILGSR